MSNNSQEKSAPQENIHVVPRISSAIKTKYVDYHFGPDGILRLKE